jgi:hypothetical protein
MNKGYQKESNKSRNKSRRRPQEYLEYMIQKMEMDM